MISLHPWEKRHMSNSLESNNWIVLKSIIVHTKVYAGQCKRDLWWWRWDGHWAGGKCGLRRADAGCGSVQRGNDASARLNFTLGPHTRKFMGFFIQWWCPVGQSMIFGVNCDAALIPLTPSARHRPVSLTYLTDEKVKGDVCLIVKTELLVWLVGVGFRAMKCCWSSQILHFLASSLMIGLY